MGNPDNLTPDTMQVMEIRVTRPLSQPDTSEIPVSLPAVAKLKENDAIRIRTLTLNEAFQPQYNRLLLLLNNTTWHEPITENVRLNDVEIWNLVNLTNDTHPIHLNLVRFLILNRTPITIINPGTGEYEITGSPQPPRPNESWYKDTVRADPGFITRIIARFGDYPGIYPWHCHILEHEDNDMMRPYRVIEPSRGIDFFNLKNF